MTDFKPRATPLAIAALGLVLTACAAGTSEAHTAVTSGLLSQIVVGFWHGLIAPVTLLVSVINAIFPTLLPIHWRLFEPGSPPVPYDVGFYFGMAGGPGFFFSRWGRSRR